MRESVSWPASRCPRIVQKVSRTLVATILLNCLLSALPRDCAAQDTTERPPGRSRVSPTSTPRHAIIEPTGNKTDLPPNTVTAKPEDDQRNPTIDDEFMTLLAEAEALQKAGRIEESMEILARLERDWSSPMRVDLILPVLSMPTTNAWMSGRYDDALRLHDQIRARMPFLADDPGMQTERITFAMAADRKELAVRLASSFVDQFPDHLDATSHLYLLAEDAEDRGDKELAADYYTQVIQHPKSPQDYVDCAKADLERLRTGRFLQIDQPESHSLWTPIVLVHVVFVAIACVGSVVWRFRRRRADA